MEADLAGRGGLRHATKVHLEWWFPAYFPGLLLGFKWLVLFTYGRYTLANTIVDLPFASLTFDLWAVITKFQGRTLRPDEVITAVESRREGMLIVVALVVHLGVYLFGVWAWLVTKNVPVQIFSTVVAVVLGILVPSLLLGPPGDRGAQKGG